MNASEHVRACIRAMAGYVPGEQPQDGAYIKLNTNENPYPPSPRVMAALQAALNGDRLRRYPDPTGRAFREAAARVLGVDLESILIGNGSDDILTILTRAFVPEGGLIVSMAPSYGLFRTLAEIQGARFQQVPYSPDWGLPQPWPVHEADLTFIANPNSPSGTCVSAADLAYLERPLVVDEAYADFAECHCLHLVSRPNVVVTRSLSKSHALAGIRFGYAVADPALVRELNKVKDSYNCDVLSLEAARAALEDQEYLQQTRAKVLATRQRLAAGLEELGFEVTPSQANFLWCRRVDRPVKAIYEELKKRLILVRYMTFDGYGDGLRITVGTESETDKLLDTLRLLA
jgi:histidinol-phosphate aminotransferase